MNTRDAAYNILNLMDEEQLRSFVTLFQSVVSDVPNDETMAAMQEAEDMLMDSNAQRFDTVEDLFAELRT